MHLRANGPERIDSESLSHEKELGQVTRCFCGTHLQLDTTQDPFLNFGLEGGRLITLSREDAVTHGPAILSMNAIVTDR